MGGITGGRGADQGPNCRGRKKRWSLRGALLGAKGGKLRKSTTNKTEEAKEDKKKRTANKKAQKKKSTRGDHRKSSGVRFAMLCIKRGRCQNLSGAQLPPKMWKGKGVTGGGNVCAQSKVTSAHNLGEKDSRLKKRDICGNPR